MTLFKKCSQNFDLSKNMAAMGVRFFALYRHEETLKKSSSLKLLIRFWNNFTGMFLGWPFSKLVHEILIHQKTWSPLGGGLFALYRHKEILKKSSSAKQLVRIWSNFTGLFVVWPFSKIVREILIRRKLRPPWGGGKAFFAVWTSEKFSKILLLWNHLSDF